jgi:hypothetical protein
MPNRTFPQNTSCSEHGSKSSHVTPVDASLAGHVIKVFADFAVFDQTSGVFIDPALVTTRVNGSTKRGLVQ